MKWQTYIFIKITSIWFDRKKEEKNIAKERKTENEKQREQPTSHPTKLMLLQSYYARLRFSVTDWKLIDDEPQFPRYAWITNTHLLTFYTLTHTHTTFIHITYALYLFLCRFIVIFFIFSFFFFFIFIFVLFYCVFKVDFHISSFLPFFYHHCVIV